MARENIYTGVVANDGSGDTLKLAFTKTNNNFVEIYSQITELNKKTANTWTSPQTSNAYSMVQVSGVSRVSLPAANTANVNTVVTKTETGSLVYVPRNAQTNAILSPIWADSVDYSTLIIRIGLNASEGFISSYDNTEWTLVYENGPISYSQNDSVSLEVTYVAVPQAWFDPQVLGYTNFRGAKLEYRAYIDNIDGYNEIGEISYAASDDNINYGTQYTRVKSKDNTQSVNLDYRNSTDKLHYRNTSALPGNLHIQWTGTVWTGQDR